MNWSLRTAALLAVLCVVLAGSPAAAAWGLHQDKMSDAWTVVSSPHLRAARAFASPASPIHNRVAPSQGIVITLSCEQESPAKLEHAQHAVNGKPLRIRIDKNPAVDLGEAGRTLTRDEFFQLLRGTTLIVEFWHPDDGTTLHKEELAEFKKLWRKGLEKLGCWEPSAWPIRF